MNRIYATISKHDVKILNKTTRQISQFRGLLSRLVIAFASMLILFSTTIVFGQPYAGKMGVEAPHDVFVDVVKQGYRWSKPDGSGGWADLTANDVDASGWPKTDARWIIDFRPVAEWTGTIDDPEAYRVNRSGTYKGSFAGQATLTRLEGPFTISNQFYNPNTNVTTFDLTIDPPGPHHGLVIFSFTNTKRTPSSAFGSGIADFRLIRPGYPANTTQVFTNEFLQTLTSANFSAIRFMNVAQTNGNVEWGPNSTLLQSWDNRKKTTDAAQSAIGPLNKKDGWAWEYVIDVCNAANMDLWLNIPVAVDNNYVTELATLVKNRLKPNLRVYLEHSNEMWNFGFLQYAWNKARAKEEVMAGDTDLNYDNVNNEDVWAQRRHARRVKEIVQTFADVLGQGEINNRVRGILAGVTPDPNGFFIVGRLPGMLSYLQARQGDPKNYIYAISVPLYYGGEAAQGRGATGDFTVQQILDSMRDDSDRSVSYRQSVINLANTYAIVGGFCSYEGGPDTGGGSTVNIGNRIRAVRDPQQKDIYKRNFANNFWDIGGNLAMQFTLASSYHRYGTYGLTDDLANPDRNYLFQAVRELIGSGLTISGVYKLTAKHSGKALDVSGNSGADGAWVQQWHDNGTTAQRWVLEDAGGGYYQLVHQGTTKCLDVKYASQADGARLIQWQCHGGDNQKWKIEPLGDGSFRLTAKHSDKALDVNGFSLSDGADVIQWTWHGGDNQRWKLERMQ